MLAATAMKFNLHQVKAVGVGDALGERANLIVNEAHTVLKSGSWIRPAERGAGHPAPKEKVGFRPLPWGRPAGVQAETIAGNATTLLRIRRTQSPGKHGWFAGV
jgi:hypothetical protein